MIDVLFISPGNASGIYQNLANNYAAVKLKRKIIHG